MATARIDRMMKELRAEPSLQFFEWLFDLLGLGHETVELPAAPLELKKAA